MRPVVAHADAAAMRHNDRAAEREPYTHAAAAIGRLMAGGIEQIEYMGPVSRGDTAAVIRDLDDRKAIVFRSGDGDFRLLRRIFQRIVQQVHEHLQQQPHIRPHEQQVVLQGNPELMAPEARPRMRDCLLDHIAEYLRLHVELQIPVIEARD